ncbi:MAG: hypothetical protein RL148_1073 [Planctomycetota bacterium]
MLHTWVMVSAGTLGACVGSFLNVVIWRLPQEDPRLRSLGGRSRCPACGAQIAWHWNLPMLGWLLLRGRAACCGARIAARYPAVELLTALLFLVLAWLHPHAPLTTDAGADPQGLLAFVFQATFLSLLVAASFIDLDHRLLLDVLTKPGMALGLLGSLVVPGLAGESTALAWLLNEPSLASGRTASLAASAVGLLAGFGVMQAIRVAASRIFRKEAMGFGDVKFLAMIGAFLGWQGALSSLMLACVAGALVGTVRRLFTADSMIPFGPFLAVGAVCSLFWGEDVFEFLFVTWPEWQRQSADSPLLLGLTAFLSLIALILLVRKGRANG